MDYKILPSILSADMMILAEEVEAVISAGADMIHFDVMDNHYVPNLTIGPVVCERLRQRFKHVPIDVHLMVSPVDSSIEAFSKAGANRISIHPDATIHLERSLQLIRKHGLKAGLVLNPATPIETLRWCEHTLDFVLVMTVNPGFGGQDFIQEMLPKISLIKSQYPHIPIMVDGGVKASNIKAIAKAGATEFVAGSAIFGSKDYAATIDELRKQLKDV